jgi:hypothetical protein
MIPRISNVVWRWTWNAKYQTCKLELIDGAKPYLERPFSVPQSLEATTKTEMKRVTYFDVFNRSSYSEWAAPTSIQAKRQAMRVS